MPRKHFLQAIFAAIILLFEFLLCRFILFDWHGMKDFPLLLFLFGMGVIFLSLPSVSHSIRFSVPIGYASGFFSGILFHSYGTDPGGGRTDDLWLIWGAVYLVCILAGIALEILYRRRHKARAARSAEKKNRH